MTTIELLRDKYMRITLPWLLLHVNNHLNNRKMELFITYAEQFHSAYRGIMFWFIVLVASNTFFPDLAGSADAVPAVKDI